MWKYQLRGLEGRGSKLWGVQAAVTSEVDEVDGFTKLWLCRSGKSEQPGRRRMFIYRTRDWPTLR